jgi:hypothetical protein
MPTRSPLALTVCPTRVGRRVAMAFAHARRARASGFILSYLPLLGSELPLAVSRVSPLRRCPGSCTVCAGRARASPRRPPGAGRARRSCAPGGGGCAERRAGGGGLLVRGRPLSPVRGGGTRGRAPAWHSPALWLDSCALDALCVCVRRGDTRACARLA